MMGYAILQYRILGGQAEGILGQYILAGIFLMYTSTISDWGLSTLLTREAARERGSTSEVSKLFRQTLALRLAVSLALFVPVILFVAVYKSALEMSDLGAWSAIILTLTLLPGALSGSITSVLNAYERMSLPAVIGIGTSVLNVALGATVLFIGWGVIGLSLAALVAALVTALVFRWVLRREFPQLSVGLDFTGLRVDRATARHLLRAGWPLMLNALLVGLFFRLDQFIIPVVGFVGVEQYQAAYSFLNFVLLITPAVTLAMFPRMSRHAVDDRPRLAYEYTFTLKVLLLLAVPIVVLTVWFAPLLITIVTGGKEGFLPQSAVALQILIFFLPFSFINGVTQYVLIALDKQRLITGVFVVTVLFNLAANLVLVPLIGIYGAALATVMSELVLLGPFLLWTGREIGRVPLLGTAWRPTLAGVVLALISYLLRGVNERWKLSPADFTLYVAVGAGLGLIYVAMVLLLRPFTTQETQTLRRAIRR
jgi:O-antigen/teichoic acid export membrane protein